MGESLKALPVGKNTLMPIRNVSFASLVSKTYRFAFSQHSNHKT